MTDTARPELILTLPRSVDASSINQIYIEFNKIKFLDQPTKFVFDLTNTRFLTPIGAITIAALSDEAKEKYATVYYRCIKHSKIAEYAFALGLLKLAASERTDYVEAIERFSVQLTRYHTAGEAMAAVELIMKRIVHRTNCTQKTEAAIAFMITELIDNARHAYAIYDNDVSIRYPHPVYVCAFSYKNQVQIAIGDRGQGIQASLQQVSEFSGISGPDALRTSLQKGVSGDPNGSPGFGLFGTSQFISANNGNMIIWSSRQQLKFSDDSAQITRANTRGTLIALEINAEIEMPFEEIVSADTADDLLERWNLQRT